MYMKIYYVGWVENPTHLYRFKKLFIQSCNPFEKGENQGSLPFPKGDLEGFYSK